MNIFLEGLIVSTIAITTPFSVYMLVVNHMRHKRLLKNQNEWNEIKKSIPNNWCAIGEAYDKYCDKLWAEEDPVLGPCFPRI